MWNVLGLFLSLTTVLAVIWLLTGVHGEVREGGGASWEGVGEGAGHLNVRICFKCPAYVSCRFMYGIHLVGKG